MKNYKLLDRHTSSTFWGKVEFKTLCYPPFSMVSKKRGGYFASIAVNLTFYQSAELSLGVSVSSLTKVLLNLKGMEIFWLYKCMSALI